MLLLAGATALHLAASFSKHTAINGLLQNEQIAGLPLVDAMVCVEQVEKGTENTTLTGLLLDDNYPWSYFSYS